MILEKFKNGTFLSLGAELEIRILDKNSYLCVNEYDYFKENINKKYQQNITSEFLKSMIEINTPVFTKLSELINYLKQIIKELNTLAKKRDLILQSSGASALKQDNLELSTNKRYQELSNEHKILLDDFSICGLHVHIGFEDFNKALKAFNFSLMYLPIFLALSASSVYSNGIDTGIHSYRTKIFDRLPKASTPEYFNSYEHMKEVYDILFDTKVIRSEKDIWWDVRIQPSFKTIEFRVCDAINDFDRLEVIIGLFKIICELSQIQDILFQPMQVLKQNMWKASRYSMNADFILDKKIIDIKQMMNNLIDEGYKERLISENFMQKAKKIINRNSIAQEMINVFEKTQSLIEVQKIGVFR